MGKIQKNQNGFSAVEAILILVIIGLIGFTGWYVWHAKSNTDKALTVNNSSTPNHKKKVAASKATPDPTASWTAYSSPLGKFTLKYPKTWVLPTNPDLCSDTSETGLFMVGPTADTAGKCGSEGFEEINVTWRSDRQLCDDLNGDTWSQNSKETVKVAGVSATKITATAKTPAMGLGAVPEGTKTVQYCFVANSKTYIADYEQQPSYPDALSDFNVLVTKTLTVN